MSFERIPAELKAYNQFVVWRLEETQGGKPTKIPYSPHTGKLASVTDPSTWGSFEQAVNVAASGWFSGIGFVLTPNDPYAVIDLDDTQGDKVALDRQLKVFQEFNSYSEKSPSGNGLHVWVKGSLESGRRRSYIEIYSSGRYMTLTGQVYKDAPIEDRQELLTLLYNQMGGGAAACVYNGTDAEPCGDQEVIDKALSAANGSKFQALLNGEWKDIYPSQSEADFAFVDIIAFYTQNRKQITRLFRASPLGKRDKAKRKDYVDWMINKSFDRILPPVDIEGLKNQYETYLAEQAKLNGLTVDVPIPKKGNTQVPRFALPLVEPNSYCELVKPVEISRPVVRTSEPSTYEVPLGLVGEIAQFFYNAAPRPVPEIALAGAIGFFAGLTGRCYNVSGTGLNQYVLLLAATGTGKEAIASGIDKIVASVQTTVPTILEYIGPAEIASPQALIKYMAKTSPSFVSLVGEFGLMLKQMTARNANTNLIGLKRILLDLYNKSGEGKVLRPMIYSDKDKNTEPILSPAFTLLGESTPEKFYEALNEGMIAEGLLPRFTIIEYKGRRPYLNENHLSIVPSFQLTESVATTAAYCSMLNNSHKVIHVNVDGDSVKAYAKFDRFCDDRINESSSDVLRQLWNRAHLKALKLGALIAVGVDCNMPTITIDVVEWSLKLVKNDINNIVKRFESGDIGEDVNETKQREKLLEVLNDYLTKEWNEVCKYGVGNPRLHYDRVIPYKYVNKRLSSDSNFRKDRLGATNAIKRAIETLKNSGDVEEIPLNQCRKTYGFSGQCFMVTRSL